MFSVTIICIKQPVHDASKIFVEAEIYSGEEKLSQKKLPYALPLEVSFVKKQV